MDPKPAADAAAASKKSPPKPVAKPVPSDVPKAPVGEHTKVPLSSSPSPLTNTAPPPAEK